MSDRGRPRRVWILAGGALAAAGLLLLLGLALVVLALVMI